MKPEIIIDVDGTRHGSCSGTQVRLILVPSLENDGVIRLYDNAAVGSGCPESVWHNRARSWSVPVSADLDTLAELLADSEDLIREIDSRYLGSEWDGSNHVGRWEDAKAYEASFEEDDMYALIAQCPQYWDAGDYLYPAKREICAEMALGARCKLTGGLSDIVSDLVADCYPETRLDSDETREVLVGWLREMIEEGQYPDLAKELGAMAD